MAQTYDTTYAPGSALGRFPIDARTRHTTTQAITDPTYWGDTGNLFTGLIASVVSGGETTLYVYTGSVTPETDYEKDSETGRYPAFEAAWKVVPYAGLVLEYIGKITSSDYTSKSEVGLYVASGAITIAMDYSITESTITLADGDTIYLAKVEGGNPKYLQLSISGGSGGSASIEEDSNVTSGRIVLAQDGNAPVISSISISEADIVNLGNIGSKLDADAVNTEATFEIRNPLAAVHGVSGTIPIKSTGADTSTAYYLDAPVLANATSIDHVNDDYLLPVAALISVSDKGVTEIAYNGKTLSQLSSFIKNKLFINTDTGVYTVAIEKVTVDNSDLYYGCFTFDKLKVMLILEQTKCLLFNLVQNIPTTQEVSSVLNAFDSVGAPSGITITIFDGNTITKYTGNGNSTTFYEVFDYGYTPLS